MPRHTLLPLALTLFASSLSISTAAGAEEPETRVFHTYVLEGQGMPLPRNGRELLENYLATFGATGHREGAFDVILSQHGTQSFRSGSRYYSTVGSVSLLGVAIHLFSSSARPNRFDGISLESRDAEWLRAVARTYGRMEKAFNDDERDGRWTPRGVSLVLAFAARLACAGVTEETVDAAVEEFIRRMEADALQGNRCEERAPFVAFTRALEGMPVSAPWSKGSRVLVKLAVLPLNFTRVGLGDDAITLGRRGAALYGTVVGKSLSEGDVQDDDEDEISYAGLAE